MIDETLCVVDNGLFTELAVRLARDFKGPVRSNVAWEDEFPTINDRAVGSGLPEIEWVEDPYLNKIVDTTGLYVFPDIFHAGDQQLLERVGKLVWGSKTGDEFETKRVWFRGLQKELGMPVPESTVLKGWTKLVEFLKDHGHCFIKTTSKIRGCFDDKTEVLSQRGWVTFDKLQPEDSVASLDLERRRIVFAKPVTCWRYWHDGDMVSIHGRGIDALVTPEHHFWIKSRNDAPWKYTQVHSLFGRQFELPQACSQKGHEQPTYVVASAYRGTGSGRPCSDQMKIEMDLWLQILGWFVSEGSLNPCGPKKNKYRISFSQSARNNAAKWNLLRSLLKQLPTRCHIEGDRGFSIYNKSLFSELAASCYYATPHCALTKSVPLFIKQLSARQIRLFLNAFALGDGCFDKPRNKTQIGQQRFYTSSQRLADDLQELLFRSGSSGNIKVRPPRDSTIGCRLIRGKNPQFCVSERHSQNLVVVPNNMKLTTYRGWVYDAQVEPHHTLLVRRNGKAFWSGNSMETKEFFDYEQAEYWLWNLKLRLGCAAETLLFLVEEPIETPFETGVDTYCVRGKIPKTPLQGIEVKGKLILCSAQLRSPTPKPIDEALALLSPFLAERGYCNFLSAEFRGDILTDICARAPNPGLGVEMEMIRNLGEIMVAGVNGELIEPDYEFTYGIQAAIFHNDEKDLWKQFRLPAEIRRWVKLMEFCKHGELYQIIPRPPCGEKIGWLLGVGNSIKEAAAHLFENAAQLKKYPFDIKTDSLEEAVKQAHEMKLAGFEFADEPLPEPEEVTADET